MKFNGGFQTEFGLGKQKAPARPDRNIRCRKRRPCGGYCGLMIEVGDLVWHLTSNDARICNDCYEARQAERQ